MTLAEKIDDYRDQFERFRARKDTESMLWLAAKLLGEVADDDQFIGEADSLVWAVVAHLEVNPDA